MNPMVYVFASLLLLGNFGAWILTVLSGPGNWLILIFSGIYLYFLPAEYSPRLTLWGFGIAGGLAIIGELIEFAASAAGAAKQGGSRRGMAFSILGAGVGSVTGAILGMPIPIIGSLVAAVLGGALGAFTGAYLGEKDRLQNERIAIGRGALIGRLLGTVGKLTMGMIMLVIITLDSFFDGLQ